jgi:tryptophan halogenase
LPDGGRGVSAGGPIQSVVVAGGGIAGWSAAAALKRRIGLLDVAVINSGPPQDALIDHVMSTLPSIGDFHQDLGLTDADTVFRANSGLRAGTIFEGWSRDLPAYVHAYGSYGAPKNGVAFHQLWLRSKSSEPFDRFSPAAELGRAGRVPAASAANAEVGYGLCLTLDRYREMMRAFALHVGVREVVGDVGDVRLRSEDGFVDCLVLSDGATIGADLFVDCTGPAAAVRSRVDDRFIDWGRWLPCDRFAVAYGKPESELHLLDRVTATESGWRWSASSPAMSFRGAAFSSAHADGHEMLEGGSQIALRQGRWAEPWIRNCVSIGDAAVTVDPLEATNLHLSHSQIDRLVSMMPGRDCAAVELAEYNRQCGAEADRVRDFICLHYLTARRDEPFWKDAAAIEPPDSLAHTLSLFAERGRLPFYEEETFTRDSWLAVLLGQGFEPRRTDPLASIFTPDEATKTLASHATSLRSFIDAQPSYRDYMLNPGVRA